MGPDGVLQKSIIPFPTVFRNIAQALYIDRLLLSARKNSTYYRSSPFKVDSVGGAFMMIRRSALNNGPLLNTDYFMYSEEKDLALRLSRAGWFTWFVPGAEIIHHGGRSTNQVPIAMFMELHKSQVRYFKTYFSRLRALALCFSWWLVLCSGAVVSLPFCFSQKGRNRFELFLRASWVFPFLVFSDESAGG